MMHGSGEAEGFGPSDFAQGAIVFAYLVNSTLAAGPQEGGLHAAAKIRADEPSDTQMRGVLAAIMAASSPMLGGGDRVVFGGDVSDPEAAAYAETLVQGLYGDDRMAWLANLAIDEMFWRALGYLLVAIAGAVIYYADTESDEMPPGVMVFPVPEDGS